MTDGNGAAERVKTQEELEAELEEAFGCNVNSEPQKYAVSVAYTFTTAEKNGRTLSVRIPPWFQPEIDAILREIPDYGKNPSNFVRDAIYHRIRSWQEKQIVPTDLWRSLDSSTRAREESALQAKRLKEMKDAIKTMRDNRDLIKLDEYILEQREIVEQTREPWRARAVLVLRGEE